jgi:hypothetical protein
MAVAADGGWLGGSRHHSATPVPAWLPMMMFGAVRSVDDYEVLLLSRSGGVRPHGRQQHRCRRPRPTRLGSPHAAIMVTAPGPVLEDAVFSSRRPGLATALADATIVRISWCRRPGRSATATGMAWLDRLLPHPTSRRAGDPRPELVATDGSCRRRPQSVPVP